MWYRFATDDYDLNDLNHEVKIDNAYNSIMDALFSGKNLDLKDQGFKGIRVVSPSIEPPEDYVEIDVYQPRNPDQFSIYNGIALDHFQGIAFASESLKKEINKMLPTFEYICQHFWPSVNFDTFKNTFEQQKDELNVLFESAINQMTRSEDISKAWEQKKYNNIPIWSKNHPENNEYNRYLDKEIQFETQWSQNHKKIFWRIWHTIRANMFEFVQYIPDHLYKKLWLELIPV